MDEALKNNPEIKDAIRSIQSETNGSPAVFVGQSRTKLVLGRTKFKVQNTFAPTTEDPQGTYWSQEHYPKELTELEKMYNEFCKNTYNYLIGHSSMQGAYHPHRIIFPHFYYEVIDKKFPVE